MGTDFEIGHFLRSRIIPKAVLYYTGDIVDDEDEDFDVRFKKSLKYIFGFDFWCVHRFCVGRRRRGRGRLRRGGFG